MTRTRKTTTLTFALIVLVMVFAFVTNAQAIMLVSVSEEKRIGKQVEQNAIKEYGGLSNDPQVVNRVRSIGADVAKVAPRKGIEYTYKVLNSNEVNAFACPGGPVLITKRLATMLETDDELAFVLAHETGHIVAQHGRKAINQAYITAGLAAIFLKDANNSIQTAIGVMYTLWDRGYSRSQEYQADHYGVEIMGKAGYDTEGAVAALARLGMKRQNDIVKYFSTHPDTPDRVDKVAQLGNVSQQRKNEIIYDVTGKKPETKPQPKPVEEEKPQEDTSSGNAPPPENNTDDTTYEDSGLDPDLSQPAR